ncbi:MAG: hypothetical protein RR942_12660 [Romboutsia sp.]
MTKNNMPKYTTYILYFVYVYSAIYFLEKKEVGNVGISIVCLLGTSILYIVNKKYKNLVDKNLYIVLILFILFSSLLGTCYRFYDIISNYDDFLHVWSGFISVSVAFSLLNFFNKQEVYKMSKFFIVIFLFVFSMGVASLWEIIEFLVDEFLGMNTQVGGLTDTVVDMIDALIGSIIIIPFIITNKLKNKYDYNEEIEK